MSIILNNKDNTINYSDGNTIILQGSASYTLSSSHALNSDNALNADTASIAITASYFDTSEYTNTRVYKINNTNYTLGSIGGSPFTEITDLSHTLPVAGEYICEGSFFYYQGGENVQITFSGSTNVDLSKTKIGGIGNQYNNQTTGMEPGNGSGVADPTSIFTDVNGIRFQFGNNNDPKSAAIYGLIKITDASDFVVKARGNGAIFYSGSYLAFQRI